MHHNEHFQFIMVHLLFINQSQFKLLTYSILTCLLHRCVIHAMLQIIYPRNSASLAESHNPYSTPFLESHSNPLLRDVEHHQAELQKKSSG